MPDHILDISPDLLPPPASQAVNRILQAALRAADPREAVKRALANANLFPKDDDHRIGRIRVVGAGKAAQAMSRGLVDVFGARISDGLLITKHPERGGEALPGGVRVLKGGHPVPDEHSLHSAEALADFLSGSQPDDLVCCLISGGGSALMTLPQPGIGLDDLQALTRLLLACGAEIGEINTLRKHLDRVKGGGLARLAAPARVVTLVLSDVIGSPLDVIASGPTVADPTTYADALAILAKYRLEDRAPAAVLDLLRRGAGGELAETVKPGDPILERVTNTIVASNPQAAEAAIDQARAEGFHTLLLTTYLQGEASQAGVVLASLLRQVADTGQPLPRPACIVAGGETTVTLKGQGRGGRNQELALGAARLLDGLPNVALVTLATDGEDGPTDAAGAVVTGETLSRARALGLNPQAHLDSNDAYAFFEPLGALLRPGPTGTNVNDLAFLFAFES